MNIDKSLKSKYPDLAEEWNYDRNGDFTPDMATPGMGRNVWWKCAKNHEWRAVIQSRVRGNGCPYCGNAKVLKGFNDLETTNPELMVDWDYTKNEIKPDKVLSGSPQKAWWKCHKCGYSWSARINSRSKKEKPTGCPACAGKVAKRGVNDLKTLYPQLIEEWDYEKNTELDPGKLLPGSSRRVWWIGECGHEWCTTIANRTSGKGCPYCAGIKTLSGFNDLATVCPDLLVEWDFSKNNALHISPQNISAHNNQKVWWRCTRGHSYSMRVGSRAKGHGCPYCAGERPIIGENDLATTNPEIAEEWHPIKNANLTPQDVMRYTEKKVWWLGKCGHEWQSAVARRVASKMGCPICNPIGTSFPEQAIFYYIKQIYNDVENRYIINGVELDLYIESIKTAIEYDGKYYHSGNKRLQKDNKKDLFCIEQGIQIIRVREEGLENTESAINIIRDKPYLDETLEAVIRKIITIIAPDANIRINLNQDQGAIILACSQHNKERSLAVLFPELAKEWDEEKNSPFYPSSVFPGSNRKVWWICTKGHSYSAVVSNRTQKNSACPYCSGHKTITGENDLFTLFPELKKEWDKNKNQRINPDLISAGSGIKAWWICSTCGFSWKTTISDRTGRGRTGCPACAGKSVWKGHNDLATMYPEVAKLWNYKRNTDCPSDYVPGSEKEKWWICSKNHEYKRKINLEVASQACPLCKNRIIVPGINDLKTLYPKIIAEWDYDKNVDIMPEQFGRTSRKIVWWKCSHHHSYQASIESRTTNNSGCPYCSGRKIIQGETDFESSNPILAREWDYEKNTVKPNEVSKGYNRKIFWRCSKGHSWSEALSNRVGRNTKCPYCFPRRSLTPGVNDLDTTEPGLASEWDYNKNAPLTPKDVMRGSGKKVWWICRKGHSYYSSINMRASQGLGCPYCSGQRVLTGFNDLATTHPELLTEWDYSSNSTVTPYEISRGCNKKVWWVCSRGHHYEATVNSRAITGNGCPFCSGHRVWPGFNDIVTTHPNVAKEWLFEKNGELTPRKVSSGSNKKVWWHCRVCGFEWEAKIQSRCHGGKCPNCKEKIIIDGS